MRSELRGGSVLSAPERHARAAHVNEMMICGRYHQAHAESDVAARLSSAW